MMMWTRNYTYNTGYPVRETPRRTLVDPLIRTVLHFQVNLRV